MIGFLYHLLYQENLNKHVNSNGLLYPHNMCQKNHGITKKSKKL